MSGKSYDKLATAKWTSLQEEMIPRMALPKSKLKEKTKRKSGKGSREVTLPAITKD